MKKYSIYFGLEFDYANRPIDPISAQERLADVQRECIADVGGYTMTQAHGGYRNDAGEEVQEKAVILDLFCDSEYRVMVLAHYVRLTFCQESVSVVFPDGAVRFVSINDDLVQ